MLRQVLIGFAALTSGGLADCAHGADWIVAPSTYSHDPMTGERVTQYTPIGPFYIFTRPDFATSGFHWTRSTIRAGGSTDHYHRVDRWGPNIRPYGEWLFPYRPYSTPYPYWGPPYGGLGGGFDVFGRPLPGHGFYPDPRRGNPGDDDRFRDDRFRDDRFRDDRFRDGDDFDRDRPRGDMRR